MKMITVGGSRNACWPAVPTKRGRRIHVTKAYAPSSVEGVRCIAPNSSLVDSEGAIKTLGQAYISHRWCRDLQIRLGKEQDLFQGLARLQLDTFSQDPVLLLSEDCKAAGILLSNQQEAHLVTALRGLEFSVIAGTLQIMQAMPEGRLPQLTDQMQQLQETALAAGQQQGYSSYLKLMCLGVRPEVQSQGLGRALLAAALARAQQEQQILLADVADAAVQQMLERHGFKPIGSCGPFTCLAWYPV